MGVGLSDFREGQGENRDKTGKMLNFYISQLSLNGKNTPHFTILTSNPPFDSRIEPEN